MIGSYTSALLKQSDGYYIYLVDGTRDSKDTWCYLSVPHAKQRMFEKALEASLVDLAEYGNILFSGTGVHPPEEITRIIEHYYLNKAAA